MLLVCACLSVALHAVVLTLRPARAQPLRIAAAAPGVQTQWARARIVAAAPQVAEPTFSEDAASAPPAVVAALHVSSTHRKAAALSIPPPVPEAQGVPSNSAPAASMDDRGDYVPRPLRTVRPIAKTRISLVTPPGQTQFARYTGILSLFIDEAGRVQHISSDEPQLPPAFEQAAREAFRAAEFSPGEVEGQAVGSRLRVELDVFPHPDEEQATKPRLYQYRTRGFITQILRSAMVSVVLR